MNDVIDDSRAHEPSVFDFQLGRSCCGSCGEVWPCEHALEETNDDNIAAVAPGAFGCGESEG